MWIFFSDVHLDRDEPRRAARFLEFVVRLDRARASGARIDLVCLGDLVEFWLEGSDYDLSDRTPEISRLAPFRPLFLPGNRDFLAGPRFAAATGATILADEWTVTTPAGRIHLLHGDRLCADDWRYQLWRAASRRSSRAFRILPRGAAEAFAAWMRGVSGGEVKRKGARAHKIDEAAVRRRLAANDARILLAGHTHRPEVRNFPEGTMTILGNWDRDEPPPPAHARGSRDPEIFVVADSGATYFGPWGSALESAGLPPASVTP